jgi:hypothetical protein
MQSTEGMTIRMTRHACKIAASKGFDADTIMATFNAPDAVEANSDHPGQYRVRGNGLVLVGAPTDNTFMVITCKVVR